MTVPELIDALQSLPGDNDLRIVFVEVAKPRAKKTEYQTLEARVQRVAVRFDGVYLVAPDGKF